jgi:hypothetical protein
LTSILRIQVFLSEEATRRVDLDSLLESLDALLSDHVPDLGPGDEEWVLIAAHLKDQEYLEASELFGF